MEAAIRPPNGLTILRAEYRELRFALDAFESFIECENGLLHLMEVEPECWWNAKEYAAIIEQIKAWRERPGYEAARLRLQDLQDVFHEGVGEQRQLRFLTEMEILAGAQVFRTERKW